MTPHPPTSTSAVGGGSGLLQEFRKKIGKYAAVGSPDSPTASSLVSSRASELTESGRRTLLSPHSNSPGKPSNLMHRIGRFEEHDALLQQLEIQLTDMLTQLNGACRAMGSVVEVFTQTFRHDAASYKVGVDYLSTMKLMRRERAHLMEQAMRFTVLDPLASKLARHAALQEKIAEWRQLQRDVKKAECKKWSDIAAKEARLGVLHRQLNELERELGEALDNATNATAVHQQVDLFTTMRLQLATFFYHTNHSLFSRLSGTEAEIVVGVGPSPRSPVASAVATTLRTPKMAACPEEPVHDEEHELEDVSPRDSKATLTASSSDELAEDTRGSITLEEFEQGMPMPLSPQASKGIDRGACQQAKIVPLPELLALASHPVVEAFRSEEYDTGVKHRRQWKPASVSGGFVGGSSESSVFSVLRKSFNDKFNSPKSSDKAISNGSTPPTSPTAASAPALQQPMRRRVVIPAAEWASVEAVLWSIDTTKKESSRSQAASTPSLPTLQDVVQHEPVLFALSGFLCVPAIARLSISSRRLHERLRHCPAAWKRSIRLGGLTRPTRSAVWLSVLYGGTPWLSSSELTDDQPSAVPHHLQFREQRKQIYEGLLIKLGSRIADGLLQTSFDEDSEDADTARLVVWLREIDVDVVRTCSRAIYATKNATPAEVLSSYRSLLEGTIRRVLRAYVMYNPRVGYCQGMNFLVRLLMEVCCGEADEADCFWLFVGLCEPENDRNLYEPGLAVLKPLFLRFEEILGAHKPQLYEHFQREGVPVAAYTARWFLTFFSACETFDASVVIRILDAFAIDGWRVIFGMAIVVLDELEPQLLAAEMEAILRILQTPRDRLNDRDWAEQIVRRGLAFSLPRRVELMPSGGCVALIV